MRRRASGIVWMLSLVVLALFAFSPAASAQTSIYHIRGNVGGNNNIWRVDSTTGAETIIYANYPGGNAATLAQRPSDGMLFYAINAGGGSNGAVYRFNPATPAVAPVLLGTLGAGVGSGFRMAFLGNTLYFMPGGGGADNDRLYTASVAGGAATFVGTVTFPGGITPNTLGIAFDSTGRVVVQTINPSNLYRFTLPSLAATLFTGLSGGTSATGDLASAVVPAPDISVTKTDGVASTYQGAVLTYTIVVRNNGTYTVSANLLDTVPASLTGVTWSCAASAGSTCDAAAGSGNSINTGATLLPSGTATYTVSATVNVSSGSIANTATVNLDATWLTESNTTNNSATDTDTVVAAANIAIAKTASTTFAVGNNATYTLAVSNAGPQTAAGTITVSDTLPAGLTYVSGVGTGWACSAVGQVVTCTRAASLASGVSAPNITLTVSVAAAAAPNVSNTASVSSPTFDPVASNNSSTANTPVLYIQLVKSQVVSGSPVPGAEITYTVTFNNLGGAAVQSLTIVDMVPFNTDFKVGSAGFSYAVAPTIEYSNAARTAVVPPPPPIPFTLYTPVGAPGSYDPLVNWVRWTFPGSIPSGANGNVSFTVRIR